MKHDDRTDVRNFGVILLEMIKGRPVKSETQVEVLEDQALPLPKVLTFCPAEENLLLSKLTSQKEHQHFGTVCGNSTLESHFSLPAQLAPSLIRPRRLFFTPHSAMPTEDSHDTPHYTPREGTSGRKPSADVNLQAKVELFRASITKMFEKYEHLHTKNVELEHDYRTF
ncbi:hypothetical protein L3X38_036359 [Prunus dulcis]|uniref:Uncharacterized protein n=1 Tax=Prunus dulcis TaxID=3755 RepID=A0AAD4V3E2_PRUDU|nr:hypothetical protein L3X38_036359 [Prunus dulcis]